jgi:hypothetical protein
VGVGVSSSVVGSDEVMGKLVVAGGDVVVVGEAVVTLVNSQVEP